MRWYAWTRQYGNRFRAQNRLAGMRDVLGLRHLSDGITGDHIFLALQHTTDTKSVYSASPDANLHCQGNRTGTRR